MADEEGYGDDPQEDDDPGDDVEDDLASVASEQAIPAPVPEETVNSQHASITEQAEATQEVRGEDGVEEKPEGSGEAVGEVVEDEAAPAAEETPAEEGHEPNEAKAEGDEAGDQIPEEEGGDAEQEAHEGEEREMEGELAQKLSTRLDDEVLKERVVKYEIDDDDVSPEQHGEAEEVYVEGLQGIQVAGENIDTVDILALSADLSSVSPQSTRKSRKSHRSSSRLSNIQTASATLIRKVSVKLASSSMDQFVADESHFEDFELPAPLTRDQMKANMADAKEAATALLSRNDVLHAKLADYFIKRHLLSSDGRHSKQHTMDDDHQYYQLLDEYRTRDQAARVVFATYKEQRNRLAIKSKRKQEMADLERSRLLEVKRHVAQSALHGRSGKPISEREIENAISLEQTRAADMVNVMLEHIKLRNILKKKEIELKSKDEFAEGLSLVDFDLIKIENETCNEKIEERNEELLKLRKKNASTVQVLTHIKEKLRFVQRENQEKKTALKDVEQSMSQSRIVLSRTKQARDALREDNRKLRNNSGLIGNRILLENYEYSVDELVSLRARLEVLQKKHAEFSIQTANIKEHINNHIKQTRAMPF